MRRFTVLLAALSLVLGASAALAEADLGFKGIGGHLDYVDPENIDAVFGFGGVVDLGTIAPKVGLQADVDYWSKSYDFGGGFFATTVDATFRVISIGATAKYYIPVSSKNMHPFAGGGLAVHLTDFSIDASGYDDYYSDSADASETKVGFDLCGGTMYNLSKKLDGYGELRFRFVSDVNQFVLRAGLVYKLGQ